jgi:hypothetical protein
LAEKERKKPEHEIRRGTVVATIWGSDRSAPGRYHVVFKRLFKVDGGWRDSRNLLERDLPALAELAGEVARWIEGRRMSAEADRSGEPQRKDSTGFAKYPEAK